MYSWYMTLRRYKLNLAQLFDCIHEKFIEFGEEREIRLVFNWCLSLFSHRSNREKTENREKRNQLYNLTKHTILEQIWA